MNILHEMTSSTSPGTPLKKESIKRSLDFDKCVLCQKVKDNKGDKKLTSTEVYSLCASSN